MNETPLVIGQVTARVAAVAGLCKKLRKLGLEGLLLCKNRKHVSAKGLHIRRKEDSVLLGLIPECVKALSKGEHRVLQVKGGTGWGRL